MKIIYFSWLKHKIGVEDEEVTLPKLVFTGYDLMEFLSGLSPAHAEVFSHKDAIKMAVDKHYANLEDNIRYAKEIAFFPPVTGG